MEKFNIPFNLEFQKNQIVIEEEIDDLLDSIPDVKNTDIKHHFYEEETFEKISLILSNLKEHKNKTFKIFKLMDKYLLLGRKQLDLIKSLNENLLRTERPEIIRRKNFIKYAVFLGIKLLYNDLKLNRKKNIQEVNIKKSKKKIGEGKNESKQDILKNVILIFKEIEIIFPNEIIEPNLIKHTYNLVFKLIEDVDIYQNNIFELFFILLEKKQTDLDHFKTNFIYIIDDNNENPKIYIFLADLFSILLDKNNNIFSELIYESFQKLINKLLKNNEVNLNRNAADLLNRFSDIQPAYLYNNFTLFRSLFACGNYLIRNSLCVIICNIIKYLNKRIRAGEEHLEKNVLELFKLICSRVCDKIPSCRIEVLKSLAAILETQRLGLLQINEIVKIAFERTLDISAFVRKRALVILQGVLIYLQVQLETKKVIEEKNNLMQLEIQKELKSQNSEESLILDSFNTSENRFNIMEKKRLKYLLLIHTLYENLSEKLQILLYSKNISDIKESLRLVFLGNICKIEGYFILLASAFNLIWLKENSIKEELFITFFNLYIDRKEANEVINNLCDIMTKIDHSQKICFEEIIKQLYNNNKKTNTETKSKKIEISSIKLHFGILNNLWNYFIENYRDENQKENALNSLYILRLGIVYQNEWLLNKIRNIFDIYRSFIKEIIIEWKIVEEFVLMFGCCKDLLNEENKDMILKINIYFLLKYQGCLNPEYVFAAEKIIHLIFIFRNDPEILSDFLLKRISVFLHENKNIVSSENIFENLQKENLMNFPMTQMIEEEEPEPVVSKMSEKSKKIFLQKLIHLIYISGEISLKFLYFVEKIDLELQKKKLEKLRKESQDELQQAMGGPEAEYERERNELNEIIDLMFEKDNLLSGFLDVVKNIIKYEKNNSNPENSVLFTVSINTLIKFMILNTSTATRHLPLLYELLKNDNISEKIKSNIIIGIGDLFHRYPNLLNPKIRDLFLCLKSTKSLKRTTITVLSHLILNDYVKIKAEIADFVLLLDDDDNSIVENTKIFFLELNQKDPTFIINILPDAIGRLSVDEENGGISEIMFEKFSKYILEFIEKANLLEKLVEKLILRLRETESQKEVRNILISIYHLNSNEKNLKKMNEYVDILRTKIEIEGVPQICHNLIIKYKKNPKIKKSDVEDFENALFTTSEEALNKLNNMKNDKLNKKKRNVKNT